MGAAIQPNAFVSYYPLYPSALIYYQKPMPTDIFYLIGAGGHARVVCDALLTSNMLNSFKLAWVDDDQARDGDDCLNQIISAPFDRTRLAGMHFHVAIGNNATRQRQIDMGQTCGGILHTILHPKASISSFSLIRAGSFLAAQSVVAANASLGYGVIVNHGAVIDHDCIVSDACHIAPNATLAGGVHLGKRVLVGAGANILPGVTIGDDAVIGAGAVILQDVPDGLTVTGVPSRHQK